MSDGLDVTWEWARAEYDQMAIFDLDDRSWDTTVWSTSTA